LDEFIFKELDKFEKPKEIVFISECVETNTKKVNRIQTLKKIDL